MYFNYYFYYYFTYFVKTIECRFEIMTFTINLYFINILDSNFIKNFIQDFQFLKSTQIYLN